MQGPGQFSETSQRALLFAWAAAQERTRLSPDSASINPSDLLVGIVLAQPGASEAELTFRRYGLFIGQALPQEYPALTAEALNQHLQDLSPDDEPPLDDDTDNLIRLANEAGIILGEPPGAEPRVLWWALLTATSPASRHVQDLLARRGVNTSALAAATREWIMTTLVPTTGQPTYADVLEQFPVEPAAPVDVVNYKADQTGRGGSAADPDDYVGISPEADAFAYLLASRTLDPPLAVGLFGDWGSGKSFFLDAIRRRIDQLIASDAVRTRPQFEAPFWKRIVQVEFNAWHYVDGDLWSSLVDHIITQLNLASENRTDDIVEDRQRYYLQHTESATEALVHLEVKQEELEQKRQANRKRYETLVKEVSDSRKQLQDVEGEQVADKLVSASAKAAVETAKAVNLEGASGEKIKIGDALAQIDAAQDDLRRIRSLVQYARETPSVRRGLYLSIGLTLAVSLLVWMYGSGTASTIGGLVTFLLTIAGPANLVMKWLRARADELEKAREAVRQDQAQQEAVWREQLEAAHARVLASEGELADLQRQRHQVATQIDTLRAELAKPPSNQLYDYLRKRYESGDYSKRLGVPALIRRDFKGISELIHHQNRYLAARRPERTAIRTAANQAKIPMLQADDPRTINRIILYIDDLDRCPDGKVVDVLQAVHLLLAFPLFVVVVAVDSRWLAHALQTRFPALAGGYAPNGDGAARPDDYLEKIFQIPFWVRPLDDDGRSRIVRGLLGRHVRYEAAEGAAPSGDEVRIGVDEAGSLMETIGRRTGPPLLDAAALTVTPEELVFLDTLGPLMGATPRAVKRFVNVYQLIKILRRGRAPVLFGSPSDDEVAAFLLALAEGLPGLAARIFERAADRTGPYNLSLTLDDLTLNAPAPEVARLKAWLQFRHEWNTLSMMDLGVLATEVRRFVFGVSRRGSSLANDPRPYLVHLIQDR